MADNERTRDLWSVVEGRRRALLAGHRYVSGTVDGKPRQTGRSDRDQPPPPWPGAFRAKPGSHDDGPLTGLFLGGIGAPVCGRNIDGRFSRWHLQNGYHVNQTIDEAFVAVRWATAPDGGAPACGGYFRLAGSGPSAFTGEREVLSLFPVIQETYRAEALPFELSAEFFTPIIPDDNEASTLPLWYASISVRNTGTERLEIDAACFWPNLLGWRAQQMATVDRPAHSWPSQTHAGNTARLAADAHGEVAVMQQRHPGRPVSGDTEGVVLLCAGGEHLTSGPVRRTSFETCFKAGQNAIDRAPHEQGHTVAWVEERFAQTGLLPRSPQSWSAHWDEAIGSAVSHGCCVAPGESARLDFVVIFDWPIVRFGSGRNWYRRYCRRFGRDAARSLEIARFAADHRDDYRSAIEAWHHSVVDAPGSSGDDERRLRGAMLNELYFMNGGGAVWVEGCADQRADGIDTPLLGDGEHAGLLEGYDVGYCYYNTSDLWPYAWYAVSRWWPDLARGIFSDLLETVPLALADEKMIYRTETMAPLLVAGKIPHDLGSVMDDPWHRINGYQMRDNSNLWKDHNPAFILSLYLHHQIHGLELSAREWSLVRAAGLFALSQADADSGLPVHDEFGDSTWDNLGIRGRAAYSGGLTIGALAALVRWAEYHHDTGLALECRRRLVAAQRVFVRELYTGEYYRVSDAGKYADCVMGDSVLGIFLADLAGLGELLDGIDRATVRSHLKAAYRYCFLQYNEGRVGPLLLAASGRTRFAGDGGDELQVNEVIVGSAWMSAAMMRYYGLAGESSAMTAAMVSTLYGTSDSLVGPDPAGHQESSGGSGLQFRTPAAWDSEGRFRAPMNMRPLAIWFLAMVNDMNWCEKCAFHRDITGVAGAAQFRISPSLPSPRVVRSTLRPPGAPRAVPAVTPPALC